MNHHNKQHQVQPTTIVAPMGMRTPAYFIREFKDIAKTFGFSNTTMLVVLLATFWFAYDSRKETKEINRDMQRSAQEQSDKVLTAFMKQTEVMAKFDNTMTQQNILARENTEALKRNTEMGIIAHEQYFKRIPEPK